MLKVTLITATYNSAATVADTMESVLAQTYTNIEHVVVDGGSKDGTMDIVRSYEPRYGGRLRWISEPDRGIYDAMNKGVAMATGDVVGLINSDDFYTSADAVECLMRKLEESGADAVYADVHFVHPTDLGRTVRYYTSRHFRRWQMPLGFMPAHPTFYCRRSVYGRFGTFSLRMQVAADFEFLLRTVYRGRIRTAYLPKDCVTMRTHGASSSGMPSHAHILRDHMLAYRMNGVWAGYLLDWLRYPYRVMEKVKLKLTQQFVG